MLKKVPAASLAMLLLSIAPSTKAFSAPACEQAVQSARALAAKITADASTYFGHRKNFIDLIFGPLRNTPNAKQLAQNEKANADAIQQGIPNSLASLQAVLETVKAQKCLPDTALQDIEEPATKWGRKINLGQFPSEIPTEDQLQ
jgi:hypothetical protein